MWFPWRVVIFQTDLQLAPDQSWATVISHFSGHGVQGWAPDRNQANQSLFHKISEHGARESMFALWQLCSLPCERSLTERQEAWGMFWQSLDPWSPAVSAFPMVWSRYLSLWNPSSNLFTRPKLVWVEFLSCATKWDRTKM